MHHAAEPGLAEQRATNWGNYSLPLVVPVSQGPFNVQLLRGENAPAS